MHERQEKQESEHLLQRRRSRGVGEAREEAQEECHVQHELSLILNG